jgi:cyanophycinase
MKNFLVTSLLFWVFLLLACNQPSSPGPGSTEPSGSLFIIGGGTRPPAMIQRLIQRAGVQDSGTIFLLPMASSEPDSAVFYGKKQFLAQGISEDRLQSYNFEKGKYPVDQVKDLKQAKLIYITGGDQQRFMEVVAGSPVFDAIHEAYSKGATVAGTSAGAAVMSKKMITGNEFKHPEYTGDFRTIEADNMELVEGLGLLPQAIVDQHFIYRMRMNRLISVAIENPEETCIGIDESTAILVHGDTAEVVGEWQVVVLKNKNGGMKIHKGLLGDESLELSVFLPGDTFLIED